MTIFDPDPSRRWLFCLTHPDDEISIAAWIRRLTSAGAPVWLSWTHATDERRVEAQRFAELAGVPRDRLFFHGATDGSVCDEIGELLPRFDRMMFAVKPHVVACGAFEQGHLDHDATNYLVNATHRGLVAEIPFYHAYLSGIQRFNAFAPGSEGGAIETIALTREDRAFKKRAARNYPSQNIYRLILLHEAAHLTTGRRPYLLQRETMRPQVPTDWRTPNHGPRLRGKIERCPKWRRWIAAMDRVRSERPQTLGLR